MLHPVPLPCLHPEDNKLMFQQQSRGTRCELSAHPWHADKLGRRSLQTRQQRRKLDVDVMESLCQAEGMQGI